MLGKLDISLRVNAQSHLYIFVIDVRNKSREFFSNQVKASPIKTEQEHVFYFVKFIHAVETCLCPVPIPICRRAKSPGNLTSKHSLLAPDLGKANGNF